MRKVITVIAIAAALILIAVSMGVCASLISLDKIRGGNVALLNLKGTIVTSDNKLEDIRKLKKDDSIKAVVLRIDSPGGVVGASQELYTEIKKLSAIKPVVVSMGDVAASGGYYVACGATKIFANPGTITGSIGVRMEHVNYQDLLRWAKIERQTLKSGEHKDIGSSIKPMTAEEKELLEGVLIDMHDQFKSDIAESRKIPREEVDKIADGRVYTGRKALELGLVDQLGTLNDAIDEAAKLAGIKGDPKLREVSENEPWWLDLVLEKAGSLVSEAGHYLALYKM